MENLGFNIEEAFIDICDMATQEVITDKEAYDDLVDQYVYDKIHDGVFNEYMDTEKIKEELKARWKDCVDRFNTIDASEDVLASKDYIPSDLNSQLPKLIRDNVPELLKKENREIEYKIISGNEYDKALRQKLIEETSELLLTDDGNQLQDQLSDVLELIETYVDFKQFDKETIKGHQKQKKQERGGYLKGILLTKVK